MSFYILCSVQRFSNGKYCSFFVKYLQFLLCSYLLKNLSLSAAWPIYFIVDSK